MKERIKNEQVVQAKETPNEGAIEQVIGREGETAAFLSRCLFTFGGLGGGFAPRQLRRYVASLEIDARKINVNAT